MSTIQPPAGTPGYRDQRIGLIIFGIFQMLIGCLCALMAPMMLAAAVMPMHGQPRGQPMGLRMMIPNAILYLLLGSVFIWLGLGSIRARRWARSLTIIMSWFWLLAGVAGTIAFVVVIGPRMQAAIGQQAKMPSQAIVMMYVVALMVLACIYIVVPAAFLLFYQRASVRATCERRDAKIRWTDRCPMPVLALSLMLGCSAATWLPSMAAYHCVIPLFGTVISGVAGAALLVVMTIIMACLAWGTYRLKMAAWWGTLLLWAVWSASSVLTLLRVNLMDMYEKMGFSAAQLEMMRKTGVADWASGNWAWIGLLATVVALGYLLYVRRYFVRAHDSLNGQARGV